MNRISRSLTFLLLLIGCAVCFAGDRFYDDDPIWQEPDSQDAKGVQPREIDLFYDLAENMVTRPGDKAANVRAQNINTVDEVPDSSWYTNRAGLKPITVEDVATGPDKTQGPADGTWTVISAKNDGVTPGFTIKDEAGIVW